MKYVIGILVAVILGAGLLFKSWFAYDPSVRMTMNNSPGRTLSTTGSNNTFTISTTKCTAVAYTVNFSAALTLGTSNGRVQLDVSLDGGSNWLTLSSVSQVFGVSVTITTNQDLVLAGMVPANALVRIYRINNAGVTVTLGSQQECSM